MRSKTIPAADDTVLISESNANRKYWWICDRMSLKINDKKSKAMPLTRDDRFVT